MIEFEKKTWYNKNDTDNIPKRIPISAMQLNRIEEALSDVVNHTNDMTNYWWKKSKVVGGDIGFPSKKPDFTVYFWSNRTQTSDIYYSDSVTVKIDNNTGKPYAELNNPNIWNVSYNTHGDSSNYTLQGKYFIIGNDNTSFVKNSKDGGTLYLGEDTMRDVKDSSYGLEFRDTLIPSIRYVYGDVEYVNSPNRDEYSEGWSDAEGLKYEYLGIPFENSRESINILSGWYYGSGENSRLIQTTKKPKSVIVYYHYGNSSFYMSYIPYIYAISTEVYSIGNVTIADNGFYVGLDAAAAVSINDRGKKYGYIVFY